MRSTKRVSENNIVKRTFSAIFFGVGGAVGSRLLMFLANLLLSRSLGQNIFGQFSSLSNTVNLFVTFSGIGVSATLTRYVAANRENGEITGMYIRTLSSICAAMSVLLSVCLFVFAEQISLLSTGSDLLAVYFKIVAVTVFFASMSSVEQSIMVGFEAFAQSSSIQLLRCAVFCITGFFFSRLWGIYGAVYALLLSHLTQYVFYVIANRTRYKRMQIRLSWKWNKQTKEAAFSYAIPAFVSGLFVMPVHWIGNAMLTRTSGFSEMAVFTIANQWMQYIIYIPAQMGQMRPIYTELFVKKDLNTLRKLMIRITLMTTAAACCISAIVILARNLILPLYGSGYIVGETTFSFMIVAAILYTAQVQTGFMLQAMSKMWISVAINGLWGIALICSYSMMLNQGAVGYSLAYCVAYSITLIIQVMLMIRYLWMKKAID